MHPHEPPQATVDRDKTLHRLRIFLASPGDVAYERDLARDAITHINGEFRYRDRVNLQVIAWDQPGAAVAMEAGLTPQEAIKQGLPTPADCDLTVVILWSRMGTPLPADYMKDDGSRYLSGTEWEYYNALASFHQNNKPTVRLYRRTEEFKVSATDPNRHAILEQSDSVQAFFNGFTHPDSSLKGGVNPYATPDEFRKQFEGHLRDWLDKYLKKQPAPPASLPASARDALKVWQGSPYPGLAAFTPEQAPIYFGRGRELDQLLKLFQDASVRFVALVGVSGAGKSSLVKAGLLPLTRSGKVNQAVWRDLDFKPAERGNDPFLSLAVALQTASPQTGLSDQAIARRLQTGEQVAALFQTILARDPPAQELLLVIDQFEEVFTRCEAYSNAFLERLAEWLKLPRIRCIVTLRSDFYPRAIESPMLAELLRQDRSSFPLAPPGVGALYDMITRPAEAAGLTLEAGLPERLLDDAGGDAGAMPMIAYTLSQLYARSQGAPQLTLAAYQAFGGVQGAMQQSAETALQSFSPKLVESALPELFTRLVEVNEQGIATRRRTTRTALEDAQVLAIADALTQARLLVSSADHKQQAILEVAHETLFNGWKRLEAWIKAQIPALKARRNLEHVAEEWNANSRPGNALRTGKLLQTYLSAATPRSAFAEAYLTACQQRQRWFRVGTGVLAGLALTLLALLWRINQSDYPPTLATKALFVEWGLWPVTPPKMVDIPAGSFQMGDLSGQGQESERPVHTVQVAAFKLGQYEVTFEEYDVFAAATGRVKPNDQGWGRGNRPVLNVNWDDAVAYTQWLSRHTGLKFRLPTEAEWEYAARAGTQSDYYWPPAPVGEPDAACTYANGYDSTSAPELKARFGNGIKWEPLACEDKYHYTTPVGEFKPNAWGLHDTAGNVFEWVMDCWHDAYQDAPGDGSAWLERNQADCKRRVIRGGAWDSDPRGLRSAGRNRNGTNGAYNLGFRIARAL